MTSQNQLKLKEDDTMSYEDIPVCVCGKRYVVLKVFECYDGQGVQCDECGKSVPREDKVYYCPADKNNILHTRGYDLCQPCYTKVSDEINTDNALFQIWFTINELNKQLYHVLAQKFEINSRKSLISKSTNQIFEFVAFIDWNAFNDATSRKIFCDSYDALRSKLLSLKQSAYKFDPMQQQKEEQQAQEPRFAWRSGSNANDNFIRCHNAQSAQQSGRKYHYKLGGAVMQPQSRTHLRHHSHHSRSLKKMKFCGAPQAHHARVSSMRRMSSP
eukprot:459469_1